MGGKGTEEVAATTGTELELVDPLDPEAAALVLAGLGELDFDDTRQIQAAIALRLLTAESDEEAFRELPTWSTKDNVGGEFELRDARLLRSRFGENGRGGFVACDAVNLRTGEVGILSTSSLRPAAHTLRWLQRKQLPKRVRVTQAATSAAGHPVLDFELVD